MSDTVQINLAIGQPSRGKYPISLANGSDVLQTGQVNPYKPQEIDAFIEDAVQRYPGLADRAEEMRSQLLQLAARSSADSAPVGHEYQVTPRGLVYLKPTANGTVPMLLTNFIARIVADITRDDGVCRQRVFEVEAQMAGFDGGFSEPLEKPAIKNEEETAFSAPKIGVMAGMAGMAGFSNRYPVSAAQFNAMNWPVEHLGAQAIVYAGMGTRDHARAAIQSLSRNIQHRVVYAHTGWREIRGSALYLHAGGAIGASGAVEGVEMDLPDSLHSYVLPKPPEPAELIACIQASLSMLELGPAIVTFPAFCSIWRAPLGGCDMAQFLAGPTGVFKSELAALCQQHFGASLDARHLPGSWSSTDNALEALAFAAKDALFVIDDFAPRGTAQDIQRLHQKADRVIRAQGNGSGRQRMTSSDTMRPTRSPRGLILSTGEEVPLGQSLRGRMLISEIGPADISTRRLTACQVDARNGRYAGAMSGYIQWLAGRIGQIQRGLKEEVAELRDRAASSLMHRRTPEVVANLAIGFRYFLQYAKESGAIAPEQADDLWQRVWSALGQAAARQVSQQAAEDPTRRFLDLLVSAITSGHAHLAGIDGNEPAEPLRWGWRKRTAGLHAEWQAQGDRIGWVDEEHVYLDPNASYHAAQIMAGNGERIAISQQTLRKRLDEKGLLIREGKRDELTVRRVLGGSQHRVLQMRPEHLGLEKPAIPAIPAITPVLEAENAVFEPDLMAGFSEGPENPPSKPAIAEDEGEFDYVQWQSPKMELIPTGDELKP